MKMCIMTFIYEYALQFMYGLKARANERQRRLINGFMRKVLSAYAVCMTAFAITCRFVPGVNGIRDYLAAVLLTLTGLNSFISKAREKNMPHDEQ